MKRKSWKAFRLSEWRHRWPRSREIDLTEGRFFTEQEERSRAPVAVIGEDLRTEFFPDVTPLGKEIKIQGFDLTVIGVQEKIGSGGGNGQSQDSVVYLPSTVYNRIFGPDQSLLIFAKAKPGDGLSLDQALDLTRVALRTHYKTRPGKPDNFDTLTPRLDPAVHREHHRPDQRRRGADHGHFARCGRHRHHEHHAGEP